LAAELAKRPDLLQLTFENNFVQDVPAVVKIFKDLSKFEKLESISFRQNNFNYDLVKAICDGIIHKKELRTVDLGENGIDDKMVTLLPDALKTHVRLHMLFLDNNKLTVAGAKAVS